MDQFIHENVCTYLLCFCFGEVFLPLKEQIIGPKIRLFEIYRIITNKNRPLCKENFSKAFKIFSLAFFWAGEAFKKCTALYYLTFLTC